MPDRTVTDFPIFPLGLVALPHEYVPLHIFEPRYRTMFDECLERETEFGIVWATSDDGMRDVGCACEITRVIERMEDGRLNVLTRGTRPFRIVAEQDNLPYPAATVEFLADKPEIPDEATADAAHTAYAELVVQATDSEPEDDISEKTAYEMAATVDFGLDAKQGLLDLRSENARLRLATRLFKAAVKRLDFVERAQARARSNGKVRFG
jgi:Lon protease-like protein